jgi:hypothetical protein
MTTGIDEAPKGTRYLANFHFAVSRGILNDSEMKSFVSSLERAVAALDPESFCQVNFEPRVVSEVQATIEKKMTDALDRQNQLEQDLAAASGPRKLVGVE